MRPCAIAEEHVPLNILAISNGRNGQNFSIWRQCNVTRIDLEDDDAWVYDYDDLNRLTMEKRVDASGQSDVERWHREHAFDAVGNRTYLYWYDGSQTLTTTYNYNNLNQLTSRSGEGGYQVYYYDDNGNMDMHNDSNQNSMSWTIDNRLKQVSRIEDTIITQYAYDYQGARILRIDTDTSRTRYFFNGITEEVVKESVDGAHTDNAFAFVEKEDGESASEWDIYGGPAGASISTAYESGRRSNIIAMSGQSGNMFIIGDKDGTNVNANDTPWNATERVLSFWYIGDWDEMVVAVSTSAGSKLVHYHSSSGTDYLDANGDVHIYLGAFAESGFWQRFERNIEADYEGLAGGGSWTNTDGLGIILGTGDTDTGIDDIKLSNSMTKTFNALTGGSLGGVAAVYGFSEGAPLKYTYWCHYNNGNLSSYSDNNGAEASVFRADAYGNSLANANTGTLNKAFSGTLFCNKTQDEDAELYYFYERHYDSETGTFLNRDPIESQWTHFLVIGVYSYADGNPISYIDIDGAKSNKKTCEKWLNEAQKQAEHLVNKHLKNGRGVEDPCRGLNSLLEKLLKCDFKEMRWTINELTNFYNNQCSPKCPSPEPFPKYAPKPCSGWECPPWVEPACKVAGAVIIIGTVIYVCPPAAVVLPAI